VSKKCLFCEKQSDHYEDNQQSSKNVRKILVLWQRKFFCFNRGTF